MEKQDLNTNDKKSQSKYKFKRAVDPKYKDEYTDQELRNIKKVFYVTISSDDSGIIQNTYALLNNQIYVSYFDNIISNFTLSWKRVDKSSFAKSTLDKINNMINSGQSTKINNYHNFNNSRYYTTGIDTTNTNLATDATTTHYTSTYGVTTTNIT